MYYGNNISLLCVERSQTLKEMILKRLWIKECYSTCVLYLICIILHNQKTLCLTHVNKYSYNKLEL